MLDISKRLLYYKRKDIQTAIVSSCIEREVGIKYGDKGYGKRPDVLVYENDVMNSVKGGATSFHISEERWSNPLELSTEMKKDDQDSLRSGWDLVLDIDCPFWFYSKLTTYLFIKALKKHGIDAISCKFSGNKGFHIGVPFEAFPDVVNNLPVKNWFPDGPKKIALYLLDYIAHNFIEVTESGDVKFDNLHMTTRSELSKLTGRSEEELSIVKCVKCKKTIQKKEANSKSDFICPKCNSHVSGSEKFMTCQKCNTLMTKFASKGKKCPHCGTTEDPKEIFDALSIVNVDTILISSRHMFRAPYSMHEKAGLASIPIPIGKVLTFEKETAKPENVKPELNPVFLDKSMAKKNEARNLIVAAFDYGKGDILYKSVLEDQTEKNKQYSKFEDITVAIPPELFPPCILKILEGLEDGRKRSVFVLTNFLTSVGWSHDKAEEFLLAWNKKNKEPLKEVEIKGQVRYHKQKNKKILPPNCRSYYQDFRVCSPDGLCEKIKNPVQYSKRKANVLNKLGKTGRQRLTDDQRKMRQEYRERLKKGEPSTNIKQ